MESIIFLPVGLTPSKGRIWFNGHTETYYSQKVLPGTGLNIPGRHIASDGTIRDKDGYIVLASDDYPKGTVSRHLLELEKSMIVEVEKVILICIPTGKKRKSENSYDRKIAQTV